MQRGGQARGDYPPEGRKGGGPAILCQPNHTHWEQKAFMTIPIISVKQLISDQITSQGKFLILCFINANCSEVNTPDYIRNNYHISRSYFLNLSISDS